VVEDRKADPPSAVGGLTVIDKRVGSWGKKKKNAGVKAKKRLGVGGRKGKVKKIAKENDSE